MPYDTLADLPDQIKELPKHGQEIFLAAFNSAYAGTCKDRDKKDECAFAIAWAAVKVKYEKKDEKWIEKPEAKSTSIISSTPIVKGNDLIIPFVKDGTEAFDNDGNKFILSSEALDADWKSWEGGVITANHKVLESGKISEVWREKPFVYGVISGLEPDLLAKILSPAYQGTSQESNLVEVDESGKVKHLKGTGISIIFYPEQPACPIKKGCGEISILSEKPLETKPEINIDLNIDQSISIKSQNIGGTKEIMTDFTKEQIIETFSFMKAHPEILTDELKSVIKGIVGTEQPAVQMNSSQFDLQKRVLELETAIKDQTVANTLAIKSAIDERDRTQTDQLMKDKERAEVITQLYSVMRRETVDKLLVKNPQIEVLKSTLEVIKESGAALVGVSRGIELRSTRDAISTDLAKMHIPRIEFVNEAI